MATVYKIHPAIGIARLGNSPDEFFVGPERVYERPLPEGGFKDAQFRVKRQAARFRIFAHHEDGTVNEITSADAEITWTVHLANKKAGYPGRGNDPAGDLAIDPGPRTTHAPGERQAFDTGSIRFAGQAAVVVPLGEMRTDDANRLLVLAGTGTSASPGGNAIDTFWANEGWYDDISDGPVSASIKLRATQEAPPVSGAWVITAPPKFAPHQDNVTTLHDRVLQAMIDGALVPAPATTSYTQDIYPILRRARDIRWVYDSGNPDWDTKHAWVHPVVEDTLRAAIFRRLRPQSNMPTLQGQDSELTATQRTHMQRWKDGNFVNDWSGDPEPVAALTPAGMDRAALEACVGGAFFPGIEAGGLPANPPELVDKHRAIVLPTNYGEPFRLNHTLLGPGDVSASMALPWQADFLDCGHRWWPVPRPNKVIPQGQNAYQDWVRGASDYDGMVARWHTLGFVVQQGDRHVEVERADVPSITLLTPYLNFVDVPQGPLGMFREQPLAIEFEVNSPGAVVTLEYAAAPAHPQLFARETSVTVGPTSGSETLIARLWLIYRTAATPSALPTQFVRVRDTASAEEWTIEIDANTVARQPAAVALVLDRSASMAARSGGRQSKHAALQAAVEVFVETMVEGDAVGLVRYNQDAQAVQPLETLGDGGRNDVQRRQVIEVVRGDALDPQGATSIGDGIFEGRKLLETATDDFERKCMIVLTDGKENRPRYISEVAPEIDVQTFAIGLGPSQHRAAVALQTLAGNHDGSLLVTGALTRDNPFVLQQNFLEILAGLTGAQVVAMPEGRLASGSVQRIPFMVSDADAGIDVILLSSDARELDFRLQAPSGRILEPWRALREPALRFVLGEHVSYYRLVLPLELLPGRYDHQGKWHILLATDKPRLEPKDGEREGVDRAIVRGLHAPPAAASRSARARSAPAELVATRGPRHSQQYSLLVHAYSAVSFEAELLQSHHEPGANVRLTAALAQSGIAMSDSVAVWVELVGPRGERSRRPLQAREAGRWELEFTAAHSGVYRALVRASGHTRAGLPFTRERTLTAMVWYGAEREATEPSGGDVLGRLLASGGGAEDEIEAQLREAGIDLAQAKAKLKKRETLGQED